ncbi:hypothetical protein ABT202_38050 [Streptomyces sp900105245]|uniref:hypothetical protein n=1 Tax=Streptomyces sp. 900105245 TaxID=3154379 RepID=UPI00331FE957
MKPAIPLFIRDGELRRHITRHLTAPLTAADLARHAHGSERRPTRLFKAEPG